MQNGGPHSPSPDFCKQPDQRKTFLGRRGPFRSVLLPFCHSDGAARGTPPPPNTARGPAPGLPSGPPRCPGIEGRESWRRRGRARRRRRWRGLRLRRLWLRRRHRHILRLSLHYHCLYNLELVYVCRCFSGARPLYGGPPSPRRAWLLPRRLGHGEAAGITGAATGNFEVYVSLCARECVCACVCVCVCPEIVRNKAVMSDVQR